MTHRGERILPKFETAAEEAQWWHDNRDRVEDVLIHAMNKGIIRLGTAQRLINEARTSRNVTLTDGGNGPRFLDPVRRRAGEKGLPYQTHIRSLLHEALTERERGRAK
jgi:hypothetical protein